MPRFFAHLLGLTLGLSGGLALVGTAAAATITGDVAHTSAEFVVTHLTISQVHGTIPVTSWQAVTDSAYVPQSFTATLDATGVNTGDADRDKDLRGPDWFDVATYPTITFTSTKITLGPNDSFTAVGDLTMHGVTKSVTLQGQVLGSVIDAKGNRHVGYTATTTIDRRDFNLNWGKTTPGGQLIAAFEVTLNLEAEGIVQK
ncbi:MAG TPA: YceI family protein [Candidatus Acidoferrales bacterium]|nr:YceI family protein [Candidatus Acidoferrales bacterium]